MFNRHQAEITVMQFIGHSLPVHYYMSVSWALPCPFHQPISAHAISSPNCHWNVSLPSGASPWNSIFGGRVEGQNITYVWRCQQQTTTSLSLFASKDNTQLLKLGVFFVLFSLLSHWGHWILECIDNGHHVVAYWFSRDTFFSDLCFIELRSNQNQ